MKNVIGFLTIICFIILNIVDLSAITNQLNEKIENDGSIALPSESHKSMSNLTTSPDFTTQSWIDFRNQNSSWNIYFDKLTGQPHRAFGKPLRIEGYANINEFNINDAAFAFINQNKNLFGIAKNDLKIRKAIKVGNIWSVSFAQLYKGVEVLLSEVELRITPEAKVMAFGMEYYDNINLDVNPILNSGEIIQKAWAGLKFDNKKDKAQASGANYILPLRSGNNITYCLTSRVSINMPSTNQKFTSYVDLHEGNVVWRRNMIADVSTEIDIKGIVKKDSRFSPETKENFGNFKVKIGSNTMTADKNGILMADIDSDVNVSAKMEGSWAKVDYYELNDPSFSATIKPGQALNIEWNDDNSHLYERTLYYHTNLAHDFYKMIDPVSEAMDEQIEITITNQSYGGGPNASSDLQTGFITFWGADIPNYYYSLSPSVLYHEYGHSVNTRLYAELGLPDGMINHACHEAMADLNAALITDQPKIGYLSESDSNRVIRNIHNNNKFPANVMGESHNDGLILSGAYWDLRLVTDLDYIRYLVHYTKKMGTPDDEDLATAFMEWFIETLITDDSFGDGDNDLSNGTPHAVEIIEAFNKHNIGTNLSLQVAFAHTALEDTKDTQNPYGVKFNLASPISLIEIKPEDVKIIYSTDNFKTQEEIAAAKISDGVFEGFIPAQEKGTVVSYYMSTYDSFTDKTIELSSSIEKLQPYVFFVGFETSFTEDFEDTFGWTVGVNDDNTAGGAWEIGVPQLVGSQEVVIQPGKDHSEPGTKCLVTGASNGGGSQQGFFLNMPKGKTTVLSPTYNITYCEKPIFSFYRFFYNTPLFQGGKLSSFRTYFSSNGGKNWKQANYTTEPSNGWEKVNLLIEDFVPKTNQFMVKFEYMAYSMQSYPQSISEGLIDDIVIYTANENANITGIDESTSHNNLEIYPNPFNESVNISFNTDINTYSGIEIYDLLGNQVYINLNLSKGIAGNKFIWDGKNMNGNEVSPGIYIVKLTSGNEIITKSIIRK